ncbi:glutamate--tRNA ligase [Natronomonas sp. EA1]|uniref:glutamate--tRNA ligase n=1 Tax=Natronomonas sp. EA1 TaxID=3421655 RepID=UPI003EC0C8AC
MDDDLRERIEREAETAALFNALKHDSDAQVDAIMGPMMGENPEFRPHGGDIPSIIAPVIERVNGLSSDEKRERLAELAPELVEELEAGEEEDDQPLPDLPNVDAYDEVRMRLAPNPNGPWHLGNARMPSVIGTYKEMYDGWMLCRFDDTDPETKRPDLEAYDVILDSIDYLGFEPDEVIKASDRLETYYDHARELIELGGAYTCSCSGEAFSELKNDAEACPHRDKDIETVEEEFEALVDGEYSSGEMVLRVKTDIEHKNPALRDWVAFRVIDTPHPREEASEYRLWPMLDFQSGIDDHLKGITHIIRGIDLQDSAKRQGFVYDYFDWEYPEVVHWGHVQIDAYDVKMSTSTIKAKIESGELDGWDDPRAPTIQSVRRRGIRGEAIVDAMVELGTSTSNVDLAMSTVYSKNRDIVDDEADRAFLVREGVRFDIEGGPGEAHPPVHPDHEDRGTRDIPVGDAVFLEAEDVPAPGERVWLKGFGPFGRAGDTLEYTDQSIDIVREEGVDVVHWVPVEGSVSVRLRTMDGDVACFAEPGLADYDADSVLQFERVGFARVDEQGDRETVCYYAHP